MIQEIALNIIGALYSKLGESTIRCLVDRFYDIMDSDPAANSIRKLHPESLDSSRDKLFSFLVGRFGGPPLYLEKYGHPMLRARHAPFPIGDSERDQWLMCMDRAINEVITERTFIEPMRAFFKTVADAMRNKATG